MWIFAKFLKTPFFTEHFQWLCLKRYKENVQVAIYNVISQNYKDTHSPEIVSSMIILRIVIKNTPNHVKLFLGVEIPNITALQRILNSCN